MIQHRQNQKTVRCAIYTRKSVMGESESGDFTSLEAQRIACENYVKARRIDGWTVIQEHYDDPGYSGGTMNRPAFQRLMEDAESGRVDMIICYKIDRLSRRLVDFSDIFRRLDACNVRFASVTQEFNTDSSMGRMILNLLMTFAQFERELTSERVRDKMAATRKRGLWPGGTVPYGYRRGNKRLVPDAETSGNVKHIFELYRDTGSPKLVCRTLTQEGILRFPDRGVKWDTAKLATCLRNVVYIGRVALGKESYPGVHQPLIDESLWNSVQARLKEVSVLPPVERSQIPEALLQGLVKCGTCGMAMIYSWTRKNNTGAKYGYYLDIADNRRGISTCPVKHVSAGVLEALVEEEVMKVLKTDSMTELIACRVGKSFFDVRRAMDHPARFWAAISLADKRRLFKELIHSIKIYQQSVEIRFRTAGCDQFKEEYAECHKRVESVDGYTVVSVPIYFRSVSGKKQMVLPEEGKTLDGDQVAENVIVAAFARARAWMKILDTGMVNTVKELAEAVGVDRPYVVRILRLATLSPRILQGVLRGNAPDGISIEKLAAIQSDDWAEQEREAGFSR